MNAVRIRRYFVDTNKINKYNSIVLRCAALATIDNKRKKEELFEVYKEDINKSTNSITVCPIVRNMWRIGIDDT